MESLRIVGLPPRPDVAYRVARDRAEREQRAQRRLNLRAEAAANNTPGCHYCTSGLYSVPAEGCPCGTPVHNGRDVLAARHSPPIIETRGMRCGHCGDTFRANPPCCLHTLAAAGGTTNF